MQYSSSRELMLYFSTTVGIVDLSAVDRVPHTVGCCLSSLRYHCVCALCATVNSPPCSLNRLVCLHSALVLWYIVQWLVVNDMDSDQELWIIPFFWEKLWSYVSEGIFGHYWSRVARLGRNVPVGLLFTAIGALKFGFGALIVTFWATFRITGDHFGMEISQFLATFCPCLAPWLQKNLSTLYWSGKEPV